MKKNILSLVFFFALALSALRAQEVVVTAVPVVAETNSTVTVEVRVENWNNIASAQWSMHWDAGMLTYNTISEFNLPGGAEASFGAPPVTDANTLTFSWFDMNAQGISLDDESILFSVNFSLTGSPGQVSNISFDGIPTAIELTDSAADIVPVTFTEGTVTVDNSSNVAPVRTADFTLFGNAPNPCKDFTILNFDMKESGTATLEVFDTQGRLLFDNSYELAGGENQIELRGDLFPAAGTYLYTLTTQNAKGSRTLTVIK